MDNTSNVFQLKMSYCVIQRQQLSCVQTCMLVCSERFTYDTHPQDTTVSHNSEQVCLILNIISINLQSYVYNLFEGYRKNFQNWKSLHMEPN
jgi:hypothetical protein